MSCVSHCSSVSQSRNFSFNLLYWCDTWKKCICVVKANRGESWIKENGTIKEISLSPSIHPPLSLSLSLSLSLTPTGCLSSRVLSLPLGDGWALPEEDGIDDCGHVWPLCLLCATKSHSPQLHPWMMPQAQAQPHTHTHTHKHTHTPMSNSDISIILNGRVRHSLFT